MSRLLRHSLLLFGRARRQGAHVVQTIRQLDDEHAQVARHRHQHLAHRCCLLRFLRIELQTVEFRYAVDDRGDFGPECLRDVVESQLGVFDCVMQKRGNDGGFIEPDVGHDACDGEWMRDIRLAGRTSLVAMRFPCRVVSAVDVGERTLWVAALIGGEQRRDFLRGGGLLAPPRQHPGAGCHGKSLRSSDGGVCADAAGA